MCPPYQNHLELGIRSPCANETPPKGPCEIGDSSWCASFLARELVPKARAITKSIFLDVLMRLARIIS